MSQNTSSFEHGAAFEEQIRAWIHQGRLRNVWQRLRDLPDSALSDTLLRFKQLADPTGARGVSRSKTDVNTLSVNQSWLDANAHAYRGQWVALFCGELLASADDLHALEARLDASQSRPVEALLIQL